MVLILKVGTTKKQVNDVIADLKNLGVEATPTYGENLTILGLVGDTTRISRRKLEADPIIEKVIYIQEPYKKAHSMFKAEKSTFDVAGQLIGNDKITIIAGPCSVEGEEHIIDMAEYVKKAGATFLRGGAFKPRTSPYSFQGLGLEGIEHMKKAREKTGMPIVSEIMSPIYVENFEQDVDIIQVGARNMQNFDLLKELGQTTKPILLKRGLSATIEELLMSAEYIMASGNEKVILCERGIRTYETYTRNTMDISAIPALKKLTHLPVFADPSHAVGKAWMVDSMAKASIAAGADGLIIEVHDDPKNAWSDGTQCLTPAMFEETMDGIRKIAEAVGRGLNTLK